MPIRKVLQKKKILTAFESHSNDPTYKHFKALAVDTKTGLATWSLGEPTALKAIERAMYSCGIWSKSCQRYAIGDKVVYQLSPAQLENEIKEYEKAVSKKGAIYQHKAPAEM